ncbi:hypothetical protein RIF29_32631 [Crotalaria pallida]|uniref:Uncharacterized protein n=1 Tax=Crotalaria pallida TaxID=3830 RepID=A0AAN9I2J1_CROPI
MFESCLVHAVALNLGPAISPIRGAYKPARRLYILRQPTQILAGLVGVAIVVEAGLVVVVVVEAGCSWRIGSRFVAVIEAWARGGSCETEKSCVSERLVRPPCLRRAATVAST